MKDVDALTWIQFLDKVGEHSPMTATMRRSIMQAVFSVPVPPAVTERAQYRLGVLVGLLQPWIESLPEEDYRRVVQLEAV